MKTETREVLTCPKCGKAYTERPALSREDSQTLICSDCSTRQALKSIGVPKEEQDKIIAIIHKTMNK